MRYVVNKEKKVVVALMEDTMYNAIDFLEANYNKQESRYAYDRRDEMQNRYVGIARCDNEDDFDVEYGKKLAKARARYKHDFDFTNIVRNHFKRVERAANIMLTKVDFKIKSAEKYIKEAENEKMY